MRNISVIAFSFVLFLSACKFSAHSIGVKKGDDIPKKERAAVAELGKKVFDAIIAKDFSPIVSLTYSGSKDDISKHTKSLNIPLSATATYNVVGEYYALNNIGSGVNNNTVIGTLLNYEFQLTFPTVGEYGYLYLMELKDKAYNDNSILLSLILTKESDEWKISSMGIKQLGISGKIAPQLFDIAKQRYKDSAFVEAYLYADMGRQLLQPIGTSFEYRYATDWMAVFSKSVSVLKKNNEPPFTIQEVSTKPIFQNLYAGLDSKGVPCAVISYKSSLTDNVAIEKESLKVNSYIKNTLPGIGNISDSVIYYAVDNAGEKYRLSHSVK